MSNNNARLVATIIIWGGLVAVFGILAGVVITAGFDLDPWAMGMLFIIVLALLAMVNNGTEAIWKSAASGEAERPAGKAKRGQPRRMERLIESLDDDEIYDLEALLLARDDEAAHRHDH